MKRRFLTLTALALSTAMLVSACGGSSKPATEKAPAANTPVKGGTYTIASTIDATFLNPILNQDAFSNQVMNLIYDRLLEQNDKMEYIPGLAEAMPKVEDEGKKWTFTLRKGVKFHDGQPLTSKDVKFTFDAIMHPTYTGNRASGLTALKGAADLRKAYSALNKDAKDGKMTQEAADKKKLELWETWRTSGGAITAPDAQTVVFTLDKPFAPLLANLTARGILPEHLLKDELGAKMKDSKFNRNPVGSGKYSFVEWKTNERIVLKANPEWYGGAPNIEQVIWRVFPDGNTAMNALEKGEIDKANIEVEQFARFQNDVKHVQVFEYPTLTYRHVAFDLKNPLFKDVKVRQALGYALDKETLVNKLLQGHGIPAWSHGTPSRWDYNANVLKPTKNVEKAKQLLDEAGWKLGADGIRAKDGQKFSFDLYFVSSQRLDSEAVQVLQDAWKAIGVEVSLKGTDQPTILDMSDAGNPNRKQPAAYVLGWSLGIEPDSYSIWACDGTFNDISYCNPAIDELLNKGRTEVDTAKRKAIYSEIQAKLAEEQPYLWLWFPNAIQGVHKRVAGPITGTPVGLEWNLEKWWVTPAAK